jgi:hypothetical protein
VPGGQAGAAPAVQLLAFGALRVVRDRAAILSGELTPATGGELLLHLALHPAGHTREQIALALWPDAPSAPLRDGASPCGAPPHGPSSGPMAQVQRGA